MVSPTATKGRGTSYAVERLTLDNGLRVVLAPETSAPVVGVAVFYDVGFRSEPEGRTGFAHLFEHLMFQGSTNVGKMEHARLISGAGGVMNGSTRADYTNYYQALPSSALDLALFLEADRMRSIALTQENLDNQVAVVKEEILGNVVNQPYGGFPWITLAPVMFDSFANAHNGYGDFAELEQATLDDAQDFFETYYAPGNAVLVVAGDLDIDGVTAMVERHFGDIDARPVPSRPSFAEPTPTSERRAVHTDPLAPTPALAAGWRVPDPTGDLAAYLPYVLLAEVLSDGDASRLQRRLVKTDRSVVEVSAYLGTFGDPFDTRDPAMLTVEAFQADASAEAVLTGLDAELDRLGTEGLELGELARVQAHYRAGLLRSADQVLDRTLTLAVHEQQRGRPELLNELPALIEAVTDQQVQAAAATLRPDNRAVLEVHPGGDA